ncbi:Melibiose operon regulatory protein [Thalassocella blandensis]|nr:Melibiose operon regulatory protein [Thalassocella blandensis]
MSSKIFSIYDVSLLLLALQCLILAGNARLLVNGYRASSRILLIFFVAFAVFQCNHLLFWLGLVEHIYVYLLFLGLGFSLGPLLFLLVQQLAEDERSAEVTPLPLRQFVQAKLVHFIPLVIHPIYVVLLYVSMGEYKAYAASQNFQVLWHDPLHVALVMAMLATQITYSVKACRGYLQGFQKQNGDVNLPENPSEKWVFHSEQFKCNPVLCLIAAFVIYWVWNALAFLLSLIASGELVVNLAGAVSNILLFILLAQLCFISPEKKQEVPVAVLEEKEVEESKDPYRDEQVERIANAMEHKQLYLNPELTLEQLAEQAQIPPRLVSTIINRRFNKNFFEFTNSYRVDHAKNLLKTSDKGVSMLDIMADSGFNSKSAFNRFFKKYTEMTPTQYRQAQKKNKK